MNPVRNSKTKHFHHNIKLRKKQRKISNGVKINTSPKKIKEALTTRVKEVINRQCLEKRLKSGKKLRIKFGVDPSRPDIHLGHVVPLKKLQEFQQLGHRVVFLIGDFTARIGDPSGRSKTRPQLSKKEVEKNTQTYLDQVKKVIDIKKIEIRRNSEWYDKLNSDDFIKLISKVTLAQVLARDDFQKRLKSGIDIYPHEILYPILQAYDSIIIKADIELGGTDQKFNMLMGRTLQKRFNQPRQDVITVPLLIGLDGKKKMSKSFNNYIGVTESPQTQYGKIMSIPDKLIKEYLELCTKVSWEKVKNLLPREIKAMLAREIVALFYNREESNKTEEEFNRVFKEKKLPIKIPQIKIKRKSLNILELLVKTKLASSKSEAKRLILQKGVKINNEVQEDWQKVVQIKKGMVIQVGKRKFFKIIY